MSTWYEQAKARMRERQISQEQMAERMGVTQGAIGHWLNGRREPKLEVINQMLELLDLPPLVVTAPPAESEETPLVHEGKLEPSAFRRAPMKGIAQLGPDGYWDVLDYADGWVDIPSSDPDAYSLRVRGDSMSPAIRDGWAIWCEPNRDPVSGEYVMVRRTNGQQMVKELLYANSECVSLMSINASYGRLTIPWSEIEHIHPVGGIVPPSKISY
ncbi:Phage repressor protein C, contains Cro/C1-type HTH and peptisase s24 domains [Azotobacter beijerinckii]|uniref:Phage repressor protein C, contains Cro/C1-type HTH and peptisase s24 domains n=1 Tax=Azotobacter beijerinckii TaxID=170623 RepID=A0A1H7AN40_9GAMM|nr:LexA family transcriptional regulator [Azotobacter beijerinckii]SEJ63492.1 Phage repressor protein C, contains Cro/C1-type HTH and peptisase s24 domains [Azotobacter beijerinckii]